MGRPILRSKFENIVESLANLGDNKLLRYLTALAHFLDARATKFQILKISYQSG